MNLDPSIVSPWRLTPESSRLAAWYDSHALVRRLWGVRTGPELRIILAIEATHDNDDLLPVWWSNYTAWSRELGDSTGLPVKLELFGSYPFESIQLGPADVLVADFCWRDPTVEPPNDSGCLHAW